MARPYLPAIDSELADPAQPVPTPSPAPVDPAAPPADPLAAPATPSTTAIAGADGLNATLDQPHSLIWSGALALLMATMGLLMIGRRRRQW